MRTSERMTSPRHRGGEFGAFVWQAPPSEFNHRCGIGYLDLRIQL